MAGVASCGLLKTHTPPSLHPEADPASAPVVVPASPPVAIRIPSIKLDSAKLQGGSFMPLGLASDGTMEVPDVHKPTAFGYYCPQGSGHCGAPTPGQPGPSVVVSHVNGDGQKGGFYNLAKVKVGDTVQVDLANNVTNLFKVTKTLVAPKTDFPAQQVFGAVDHSALRLVTCGGTLDKKAHSYLSNIIVMADLLGTQPKP